VARLVMEKTRHTPLAGEGAFRFALKMGFEPQTLLTPKSLQKWQEWKDNPHHQTFWLSPENHDTIGMVGTDGKGHVVSGCSTSGLAFKIPGRVGDSPLVGCGVYADDNVGAASATGDGDLMTNYCTSASIVHLMAHGASRYAAVGFGRSRGTMPIQIAGNVRHGGLFEVGFGITLGELVMDIGGGTASGRPVRAVQVGGPLGAYHPPSDFHLPFDYEAFAAADALIGHAGISVFDDTVDLSAQARFEAAPDIVDAAPAAFHFVADVLRVDIEVAEKSSNGSQLSDAPLVE